jgi:hypothetical protein
MNRVVICLTVFGFAATGAGCTDRPQVVRHPILSSEPPVMVAPRSTDADTRDLSALASRLEAVRPTIEIGTFDGEDGSVLGRPSDVVELPGGEVLLMDALNSDLRLFSANGRYLRTLAVRGNGPAEISNPVSLDTIRVSRPGVDSASTEIGILVGMRAATKVFALTNGTLQLLRTIKPPELPLANESCASGSTVFARTRLQSANGIVASVVPGVGRPRRFGEGYAHGGSIAKSDLSGGPLACVSGGRVAVAFTYLPRVMMLDSSGATRWAVSVPGFSGLFFEESVSGDRSGGFRTRYSEPGDMIQGLHAIGGRFLVLQVAHLAAAERARPRSQKIERIRTFVVSVATGRGLELASAVPVAIGMTADRLWAVGVGREGHPVVKGYSY